MPSTCCCLIPPAKAACHKRTDKRTRARNAQQQQREKDRSEWEATGRQWQEERARWKEQKRVAAEEILKGEDAIEQRDTALRVLEASAATREATPRM